jgi:cysteine-rich repeat protein
VEHCYLVREAFVQQELCLTSTGRTWSCNGTGGGNNQTGCSIIFSYCGDGVVGTGDGYTNQEQCDDANNTNNDGCSASCQIEYPRCV